jgi:ring-1,2-phenylacetyl-CoA epoxidase subunit PaaD
VQRALIDVMDPELGIDVMSLGMIEAAEVENGHVTVLLRETYLSCIAIPMIRADITAKLATIGLEADVRAGAVWSADQVTPAAREHLRQLGIALDTGEALVCPHCGSERVLLDSAFGSAPCRAGYSCETCRTPFDVMRSPAVRAERAAKLTGA